MKIPIALQLYSVHGDCVNDLLGTIVKVAKMGYDGVEFAGFHGNDAKDVKKVLDDNNLKVPSTHTGVGALDEANFNATIDYHKAIGCTNIIIPGLPETMRNTPDACKKTCEMLTALVAKLKPLGMKTGFHAHFQDMKPLEGGKCAWDLIGEYTPKEFIMQYDTANGVDGGADAVEPILKWPGRGLLVHLKEYKGGHGKAVIGDGDIPWPEIFKACETVAGTQWYIVEHEQHPSMVPIEAVEKCLQNLRKMGK
jgi:sugar phosphate isomerase/epimerase